jgi:hypothetical protein
MFILYLINLRGLYSYKTLVCSLVPFLIIISNLISSLELHNADKQLLHTVGRYTSLLLTLFFSYTSGGRGWNSNSNSSSNPILA